MIEPVKAVKDDSGHWYVIPNHLHEEFRSMYDHDEDDYEFFNSFEETFSKYMTGGSLNNIQLWAKLK